MIDMSNQDEQLIDPENIPSHIAVIMDGNGRWARTRGLPRLEGHRQGYIALKRLITAASGMNVKVLTAYAFSSENWKRPESEVIGLMQLITYAAKVELADMNKQGVKIVCSGRMEQLSEPLRKQLEKDVASTANNTGLTLNLAINYGGRQEIVDAARKAAQLVADGQLTTDQIDEKLLASLMYHPEFSDPDIIIRTAGEQRLSNFLTWQTVYTEIFVTNTLWPDVDKDTLVEAILAYQSRTRKFGGLIEKGETR
jgi:undecaprenyl diphosphate synthase